MTQGRVSEVLVEKSYSVFFFFSPNFPLLFTDYFIFQLNEEV